MIHKFALEFLEGLLKLGLDRPGFGSLEEYSSRLESVFDGSANYYSDTSGLSSVGLPTEMDGLKYGSAHQASIALYNLTRQQLINLTHVEHETDLGGDFHCLITKQNLAEVNAILDSIPVEGLLARVKKEGIEACIAAYSVAELDESPLPNPDGRSRKPASEFGYLRGSVDRILRGSHFEEVACKAYPSGVSGEHLEGPTASFPSGDGLSQIEAVEWQRIEETAETLPPCAPAALEAAVSASTSRGRISVDGTEYDAEPHWCTILEKLAAQNGEYMTYKKFNSLPGCNGKNWYRELKTLREKIPAIKEYLITEPGKGTRLLSKKRRRL